MKKHNLFWLVPMLAVLTMPAYAGHRSDGSSRFEQRVERQHDRIRHGVRDGVLTRHEAKTLRRQQRHIAKLERRFTRDGELDRYERRTLRRKLNDASERIARLKHNDRHRDNVRYRHGGQRHSSVQRHRSNHYHASRYHGKHVPRRFHYDDQPHRSFVLSLTDNL